MAARCSRLVSVHNSEPLLLTWAGGRDVSEVYASLCTCVFVRASMRMCKHVRVHTRARAYAHARIRMCVHVLRVHLCTRMHDCVCVCEHRCRDVLVSAVGPEKEGAHNSYLLPLRHAASRVGELRRSR